MGISELAAGEGFEPSHTESESAVLPLHKPAIGVRSFEQLLLYRKACVCQDFFCKSQPIFFIRLLLSQILPSSISAIPIKYQGYPRCNKQERRIRDRDTA